MMTHRISAEIDAQNYFRCRCGTQHAFGNVPGFQPIRTQVRHADCTAWRCPGCGMWHDSRMFHGGLFGGVHLMSVVPLDPDTQYPMVRGEGGRWYYPDGPDGKFRMMSPDGVGWVGGSGG